MSPKLTKQLNRVNPRNGLRLKRWSPLESAHFNILITTGMVQVEHDGDEILVTLTKRGKLSQRKVA